MQNNDKEIKRILQAYADRDSLGLSNQYVYTNPAFLFHMQERERAIIKILKQNKININNKKILEIGCGSGHILNRFLEFGVQEAHGIELQTQRVNQAHHLYPRTQIISGNAGQLPYEDNSFDLVMQFMCFSSILEKNLKEKIANEMWRVLKPGGCILWYDLRPLLSIFEIIINFIYRNKPSTTIKKIPLSEIKQLFTKGSKISCQRTSLLFNLAGLSKYSYLLTYYLSLFPILCTHNLTIIKKP